MKTLNESMQMSGGYPFGPDLVILVMLVMAAINFARFQ